MTGYVRQSTAAIAAGEVVRAAPVNAEFNRLEQAFNGGSGHTHDGTVGNSPRIPLTTSVSGVLPIANGGTNAGTAAAARTALGLQIGVDVQAFDADLSALATLAGNGIVARTGAGTATARTMTGTTAEIEVTNGDGVAGNPTFKIADTVTFTGKILNNGTFNNNLFNNPTINNIIINSGTISGTHTGDGAGLTNLNAANIATGTISSAVHGNLTGGSLHAVVNGSADGFMSVADKVKLDSVTAGATPTTLTNVLNALNTQVLDTTPALTEEIYSNASKFSLTNLQTALQPGYDARYYQPGTTSTLEFRTSVAGMQYRSITGSTSAAMHVDANDIYFLFSDTATGTFNSRRPLRLNRTTGVFSDTSIAASGRVSSAQDLLSAGVVYSGNGAAYLNTDGNVIGSLWTSSSLHQHIESRANAFAASYQNGSVTSSRMAGNIEVSMVVTGSNTYELHNSAYVVTRVFKTGAVGAMTFGSRQPQLYIANIGWFAAFPF